MSHNRLPTLCFGKEHSHVLTFLCLMSVPIPSRDITPACVALYDDMMRCHRERRWARLWGAFAAVVFAVPSSEYRRWSGACSDAKRHYDTCTAAEVRGRCAWCCDRVLPTRTRQFETKRKLALALARRESDAFDQIVDQQRELRARKERDAASGGSAPTSRADNGDKVAR